MLSIYITFIFSAAGYLNAEKVCPIDDVQNCAMPMNQVNPSDIPQMCSAAKSMEVCLGPLAADCTDNPLFDNLGTAMNNLRGICQSSNTGQVCDVSQIGACAQAFSQGTNSVGDPSTGQGVDPSQLCSLSEDLRICLEPYSEACNGNTLYASLQQPLEKAKLFCSTNIGETTIGPVEVIHNSTVVFQDECIEKLTKCSSGVDLASYIPPGSLTKGFFISKNLMYRYCGMSKKVSKCIRRSGIFDDPKCTYLAEPMKTQFALLNATCRGAGFKDLRQLRRCINNHELQLKVYAFGNRVSGFLDGVRECQANTTTSICQKIPSAAQELFGMVDSACGNSMGVIFKRFVKRAASATLGKLTEMCPEISTWINQI